MVLDVIPNPIAITKMTRVDVPSAGLIQGNESQSDDSCKSNC